MITVGTDAINNSEQGPQDGLTKREYFAAIAMQGIVSNQSLIDDAVNWDWLAENSVQAADALIKALNKQP